MKCNESINFVSLVFFVLIIVLITSEEVKQNLLIVKGSGPKLFFISASDGMRHPVVNGEGNLITEVTFPSVTGYNGIIQYWPNQIVLKFPLGHSFRIEDLRKYQELNPLEVFQLTGVKLVDRKLSYIMIGNNAGLGNRLRVLAAYLLIAKEFYKTANIVMIWDKNRDCTSHFLELFEPIDNLVFISRFSRNAFQENALKVLPYIKYMEDILEYHGIIKDATNISQSIPYEDLGFSQFVPLPRIMSTAMKFIMENNISEAIAFHVRRTDFIGVVKVKRTDLEFFRIIDDLQVDRKVFLLTDNPHTRHLFVSKYGSRIVCFGNMSAITRKENSLRHTSTGLFFTFSCQCPETNPNSSWTYIGRIQFN